MKRITIFTVLFLLFSSWGVALGQEFHLKSGEIVSGELIGYEEGTYRVKSKYGVLSILAEDVVSVTFNAEGGVVTVLTEGLPSSQDTDLIRGTIESIRNGELKIVTEYGYVVVNKLEKLKEIIKKTPCLDIVGSWSWFNGGIVIIRENGTIDGTNDTGTWECTNHEQRTFTLKWKKGGWIDTLTLSLDSNRLEGKNQVGTKVTGNRKF